MGTHHSAAVGTPGSGMLGASGFAQYRVREFFKYVAATPTHSSSRNK